MKRGFQSIGPTLHVAGPSYSAPGLVPDNIEAVQRVMRLHTQGVLSKEERDAELNHLRASEGLPPLD